MATATIRIELDGRITDHAASSLGGWIEEGGHGSVLVAPYLDQAQLTGLFIELAGLHLRFNRVTVEPAGTEPTGTLTEGTIQ